MYFSLGASILAFRGDCNVSRNSARLAGGFAYIASSGARTGIIGGIVVHDSLSDDDGGGIFIAAEIVHISGLTFNNTVAGGRGAVIFVAGGVSSIDIANVTSINSYSRSLGAFLYLHIDSTVTLSNVVSVGDSASSGIVYCALGSVMLASRLSITGARVGKGTVYASGALEISITASTFSDCEADDSGSVIYAELVDDVAFYHTSISEVRGSAVYFSESSATLVDFAVAHASADGDGALLLATGSTVELTRCIFANSSAANGVVGSLSSSAIYSEQSRFESNAAAGSAGVFDLIDSSFVSLGMNTFVNNSAGTGDGGVFRLYDGASLEVNDTDCIEGNTAINGGGGVVFVVDFPVTSLPTLPNIARSNAALFGQIAASRAVELVASFISGELPEQSAYSMKGNISVEALDAYGQRVATFKDSVLLSPITSTLEVTGSTKVVFGSVEHGVAIYPETNADIVLSLEKKPWTDSTVILEAALIFGVLPLTTVAVPLRACVTGEKVLIDRCDVCPSGTFSFYPSESCEECDTHASCDCGEDDLCTGHKVVADKGYWRSVYDSDKVLRCRFPEFCVEVDLWGSEVSHIDPSAQCSADHNGPLCARCRSGFRLTKDGECTHCSMQDKRDERIALGLSLLAIGIGLAVVRALYSKFTSTIEPLLQHASEQIMIDSSAMAMVKMLLVFYQILGTFPPSFPTVKFPKMMDTVFSRCAIFGLDLANVMGVCAVNPDYIDKLHSYTICPVLLSAALAACYMLARRGGSLENINALRARTTTLFLLLTYMIFTTVSAVVIRSLKCDGRYDDKSEVNSEYYEDSYLFADYTVSCQTDRYRAAKIYAIINIFIYPIGIPMLYLALLVSQLHIIAPSDVEMLATTVLASPLDDYSEDGAMLRLFAEKYLDHHVICVQSKKRHWEEAQEAEGSKMQLKTKSSVLVAKADHHAVARGHAGKKLVFLNREMSTSCAPIAFLFDEYQAGCWYFEVLECGR